MVIMVRLRHLEPSNPEKLGEYLAKGLHVAGGIKATALFDKQAMDVLYDFRGVSRG